MSDDDGQLERFRATVRAWAEEHVPTGWERQIRLHRR